MSPRSAAGRPKVAPLLAASDARMGGRAKFRVRSCLSVSLLALAALWAGFAHTTWRTPPAAAPFVEPDRRPPPAAAPFVEPDRRPPAGAPVVKPDRRPFFEHPVPNTTRFVHAGFSGISAASPPADYPRLARMSELLDAWNPDHVEAIPTPFVERLAVFNFSDRAERATAALYRDAEVVLHKA